MHRTVFATALVAAGCAAVASGAAVAGDCDGIFVAGSKLASEVTDLKGYACKRYEDQDRTEIAAFMAARKFVDAAAILSGSDQDFASRLMVYVFRYQDAPRTMPRLSLEEASWEGGTIKDLDTRVAARTSDGQEIDAAVARFDETKDRITSACVVGDAMSSRQMPTRIVICRSVGRAADDRSVIRVAERIARDDFVAVTP